MKDALDNDIRTGDRVIMCDGPTNTYLTRGTITKTTSKTVYVVTDEMMSRPYNINRTIEEVGQNKFNVERRRPIDVIRIE